MKTDNFDDAIRRKLESIDYSFEEKDIDRIHSHLRRNTSMFSFWKIYNSRLLMTVYGLSIAGLLFWNYQQLEQQKVLLKNIEALQQTILLSKSPVLSDSKDTLWSSNTNDYRSNSGKGESMNTPVPVSDNSISHIGNREILFDDINRLNGVGKLNKETKVNKQQNNRSNNYKNDELISNYSDKKSLSDQSYSFNDKNDKVSSKKFPVDFTSDPILKSDSQIGNKEINLPVSSSDFTLQEESKRNPLIPNDSIVRSDSLIKNAITKNDSSLVAKEVEEEEQNKKKFSSIAIGYQVGIGVEKANKQTGFSVLGELFLNKRWSITSGVKLLRINGDRYKDADDYHYKTEDDFGDDYSVDNGSTSKVTDIDIHYNLIQVPIALTYYQPLKRNFSVLFSAGTDMDVNNTSFAHYEHLYSNTSENKTAKSPTVFINNFTFSTGLQKQWNHFVVQLAPYVSPQLRQVNYKHSDLYGGVRLRLYYRFK